MTTHKHIGMECEATGDLVCACGMRNTLCDDDADFDGGWFVPRTATQQSRIDNIQNEGHHEPRMLADMVQD